MNTTAEARLGPPSPPSPRPARPRVATRGEELLFVFAMLMALAVHVQAIFTPFTIDDYAQRAMTDGDYPSAHPGPFGLYDFVDDGNRAALIDRGILPWWTHPALVVRFLRPLSSLLLYVDYRLFGQNPVVCHADSLAWWVAACALVHVLLRRSFSPRVARLGTLIFALAPCHIVPLAWIANREALVSTTLGVAALIPYARWRDSGRWQDGVASLALFALAMSAGEYSLCFAGYALGIELVRRRDSLQNRALGVAPFLLPTAGYLALRAAFHYGTHAGGMYHDPFGDFAGFAQGATKRLAMLFCMGWLGADELTLVLDTGLTIGAVAFAGAALLALPVARALRDSDGPTRENATWLLVGSLSLAPLAAVEPSARLLGTAAVGICAVVAVVIDRAWFPPGPEPRRGMAEFGALVALGLAFVHLVHAPVYSWLATRNTRSVATEINRRMAWVRARAAGRSTVVVVRAEGLTTAIFAPDMLGDLSHVRWRVLSYEAGRVLMLRTGERSLELVASPRPLFLMGPREVFRDFDGSLHAGDVVGVDGMTATVSQLDKSGMPRRARYDFDRDLDDPSILWITENADGFEEQVLPRVGYGERTSP